MDKIDRAVVKSQARFMLKGKFFYLFIITFIVLLLTGSLSSVATINIPTASHSNSSGSSDSGDYDSFGNIYDSDNPIDNFSLESYKNDVNITPLSSNLRDFVNGFSVSSNFTSVIGIVFTPLAVTLAQVYLNFIRRRPEDEFHLSGELGFLFKHTFDATYLKKLVLGILRSLIIFALAILFIVPGVIYYYRSYFAYQLLDEYPDLKPSEAIKLSGKITTGNKGELFVLDLSFIGWYLLGIITLGIGMIYVLPYYMTTQALYYENFRLRALACNKVTEDDFLSEQQRFAKYNQPFGYNGYNNYNGYNGSNGYSNNGQYGQSNPYSYNPNGYQNNYNQNGASRPYYYNPNGQNHSNNQNTQFSKNPTGTQNGNVYYNPDSQNSQAAHENTEQSTQSVPSQESTPPLENTPPQEQVQSEKVEENPFSMPPSDEENKQSEE